MLKNAKKLMAAVTLAGVAVFSQISPGKAATYAFDWAGANGYTMTGLLTYDDSLIGTGVIDEDDIDSLAIEVFLNGASQGAWSFPVDIAANNFNLNFDTNTGTFLTGGGGGSAGGQRWQGPGCATVGFSSGRNDQFICVNGTLIRASGIATGANALNVAAVPIPTPLALFLTGLVGLAFIGRRRNRLALH